MIPWRSRSQDNQHKYKSVDSRGEICIFAILILGLSGLHKRLKGWGCNHWIFFFLSDHNTDVKVESCYLQLQRVFATFSLILAGWLVWLSPNFNNCLGLFFFFISHSPHQRMEYFCSQEECRCCQQKWIFKLCSSPWLCQRGW